MEGSGTGGGRFACDGEYGTVEACRSGGGNDTMGSQMEGMEELEKRPDGRNVVVGRL